MMGISFSSCSSFGLSFVFDNCQLQHSIFTKLKLKGQKFINCALQEVDFTEADMSAALFEQCNLERSIFRQTNLEKADLQTSFNYNIDPEANRIKKAKFSMWGLPGLLSKYEILIAK